ncbi:hypothetical protein D3C81_1316980 [compost metagenome]
MSKTLMPSGKKYASFAEYNAARFAELRAENERLQAEIKALTLTADAAGWEVVGYAEDNEILRSAIMLVFQRARNDVARSEGGQCYGTATFADYPFAKRLVRDLQPLLFPEVSADDNEESA